MIEPVKIVIDHAVRGLCGHPYPGHPKGCPNFGKKDSCPPRAPFIENLIDLEKPTYAIWTVFDLAQHVEKMRTLHPAWSDRQLACCLYWQPRARKVLEKEISKFSQPNSQDEKNRDRTAGCYMRDLLWAYSNFKNGYIFIRCPEACGVNVTATMKLIGVELEWPPVTKTFQVAIAGRPK